MAASVALHNGVLMPMLGLGTHRAKGQEVREAVRIALQLGYRHIDTATIYKNEEDIGAVLSSAAVPCPRGELFLTSKVSPYEQGYDKATAAALRSLERLGTSYLDLLLIHWPGASKLPLDSPKHAELRGETWRALEDLYDRGLCRAIGVSNFSERHLKGLLAGCRVRPMVNQIEVHPRLQQRSLRVMCQSEGIHVQAYSPLGTGLLLQDPQAGRTAAQVLLRWALQGGCTALPKSVREARLVENLEVYDFSLSPDEVAALDAMEDGHKYTWDPSEVA